MRSQNPACRMWFQRVEEVEEPEHFCTQMPVDVGEEIKIPKRPAGPSVLPGDFQRVRLMTNHKLKAKKDKELQKEYVERWKREEAEKREKARREKEEEDAKFEERFKIQLMQGGYTQAQAQAEAMLKKEKEKKEGEEYDDDSRTSVSSSRRDGTYTTVKRYRIGEDDSRSSVDRRFQVNRPGERVEETRIQ